MKKIAVVGIGTDEKLVLANALSYLTGFDIIRSTAYPIKALKLGLNENIQKCNWKELYHYTLSSFIERLGIENNYDNYVSIGSVYDELAYMKTICNFNTDDKNYANMNDSLHKIINEYALNQYDYILYAENYKNNDEPFYKAINLTIKDLIKDCKSRIFIDNNTLLNDILNEVIIDNKINTITSPEVAIRRAQLTLNIHNQDENSN